MAGPSRRYLRLLLPALGIPYFLTIGALGAPSGDSARNVPFSFHDLNILGTSMDLKVNTPRQSDADNAHAIVLAEIERLRKILSSYDSASDISKVNASKDPVRVAQELIDVLKMYDTWQARSKGAYTAGMGELAATWKNAEKDGKPPEPAVIAAAVKKLEKPLWRIDDAAKTVQRLVDVPINLDSLGKGFIVNQAAIIARQKVSSVKGILVNIGGDIIAFGGCNPSGVFTPWTVGITDPALPADNAPTIVEIHVTAMTVATSGNYARGYAFGENKYSHIIDPRTGYPVDFKDQEAVIVDSATVIAPDNTTANALATSLCVLTPEEGLALIRSTPEAQCLLIMSDGTEQRSPGFKRFEIAGTTAGGGKTTEPAGKTKEPAVAAKPSDPAPSAKPAEATASVSAGTIPKGYEVAVVIQINPLPTGNVSASKAQPYMAVWIETDQGKYVKTLAFWGAQRYIKSLRTWFKLTQGNVTTKSSATRPAGKYSFTWDGTDEKGNVMPKGNYKVCIDTAIWRNGQLSSSGKITCGDQKASAIVPKNAHMSDASVTYGPSSKGS